MMLPFMVQTNIMAADAVTDTGVFLKQEKGSSNCTHVAATMMLRRRALLEGNKNWSSITVSSTKSVAWSGGLNWDFTYAGMNVTKGTFKGMTQEQKKSKLISLLAAHPEGIVIYMYGNGLKTHAVLATDYDTNDGTVYCADPASGIQAGRIPLIKAYLTGNTQDERIGNLKMYWYVKSGNCNLTVAEPKPTIHNHLYSYSTDSVHPHLEYKYCSCTNKEYTGERKMLSSCKQCYPLGSISFKREVKKTEKEVTFYRNYVANATSYTIRYSVGGSTKSITMPDNRLTLTDLPSGKYSAKLIVTNSNTGEEKTVSCEDFSLVNTYSVSYDANGGKNAPLSQEKIQDSNLTITSDTPTKEHYIFLGWASTKNAKKPQYYSGDSYKKNAAITLYAVWEPEKYTINFDANGGNEILENVIVTYGDIIKMPNNVVKDGYYLKGWSSSKSATTAEYRLGKDYKLKDNLTLYAIWGESTWDNEVADSFAGGDGTKENPYQISNAAELAYLAEVVNTQTSAPELEYYILTDNINLGYNEWVPIGIYNTSYQYFRGNFNGNGYTISGIYMSADDLNYYGLFGYMKSSKVYNMILTGDVEDIDCSVGTKIQIGALTGYAESSTIENINVLYFDISNISALTQTVSIGGLLGDGYSVTIKSSKVKNSAISVKNGSGSFYLGGLCGQAYARIENCLVETENVIFGRLAIASGQGRLCFGGIIGSENIGTPSTGLPAGIFNSSVIADRLSHEQEVKVTVSGGGIAGEANKIVNCSVCFKGKETISFEQKNIPYSLYLLEDTMNGYDSSIGGIAGKSENIANSKYDGASLILLKSDGYLITAVGGITGVGKNVANCVSNVDGVLYCKSPGAVVGVGGILGSTRSVQCEITNSLAKVDLVKAINTDGTDIENNQMGGYAGDIYGYGRGIAESVYTNDEITLEATTEERLIGVTKSETKIKTRSFQKQLLGLTEYQALSELEKDNTAVWVMKDGQLPELYYNCLNDITVSNDIENGSISIDKVQAVDGEIVTVNATPDENYDLNKIYVNGAEIVGSTFVVSGNSDIYATFSEKIPEYEVSITANENASGTLTNLDNTQIMLLGTSDATSIIANDGEEIEVNASANQDYAIEAIYVNGEEIAGSNFILTSDTEVTMAVTNISTLLEATTNDAEDVSDYFAVVSGSVSGTDGVSRYIRYWETEDSSNIYTTEVQEGSGEYTATLMNLKAETSYSFQMTELGEIKTFVTAASPRDETGSDSEEGIEDSVVVGGSDANGTEWTLYESGALIIKGSGEMQDYSSTAEIPWYNARTEVKEIIVSENITHIGDRAFYGCINTRKIEIAKTVTSIGTYALKNCDELSIYGEEGTYAQIYASENSIPFVNINEKEQNIIVDFTSSSTKWYFDVTVENFADEAIVYAAIYDTNHNILGIDSEKFVSGDITSLSLTKNSVAAYAKIFLWNTDLKPIIYEEIKL